MAGICWFTELSTAAEQAIKRRLRPTCCWWNASAPWESNSKDAKNVSRLQTAGLAAHIFPTLQAQTFREARHSLLGWYYWLLLLFICEESSKRLRRPLRFLHQQTGGKQGHWGFTRALSSSSSFWMKRIKLELLRMSEYANTYMPVHFRNKTAYCSERRRARPAFTANVRRRKGFSIVNYSRLPWWPPLLLARHTASEPARGSDKQFEHRAEDLQDRLHGHFPGSHSSALQVVQQKRSAQAVATLVTLKELGTLWKEVHLPDT